MKEFIKYVISILTLIILLLFFCDFVYTQVYLNSTPRNKLQYILNTENQMYDVVFMGSSRVANHIDTQLFDSLSNMKTLNLGVEGAGLNDNLLQLKLLLSKNNVSNIFLQIDSNYEYEKPSNISISEAMPFLNQNEIINEHVGKYFKDIDKLEIIPFYRYAINDPKIGFREMFLSSVNKRPRVDPSIGYSPKFGNKLPLKERSLPKQISQNNIILDEITEVCKRNNIELTLFLSPFCSNTNRMGYINKLAKKNPKLIDLSEGYNDEFFYDCGHLNNKGAKLFTTSLYKSTIEILKK